MKFAGDFKNNKLFSVISLYLRFIVIFNGYFIIVAVDACWGFVFVRVGAVGVIGWIGGGVGWAVVVFWGLFRSYVP